VGLSVGGKIAKIGPVDHEIIVLAAIIKKREKRKKLPQAKYTCIALPASLPSGLKKIRIAKFWGDKRQCCVTCIFNYGNPEFTSWCRLRGLAIERTFNASRYNCHSPPCMQHSLIVNETLL